MTAKASEMEDWYLACSAEILARTDVRRAAQAEVARLSASNSIELHNSDIEAARPYLKKCLRNMSPMELETLTAEAAGALWARGALGAARYRQRQGKRKRSGLSRRAERVR
jgi:hypothetical protein